MKKVFIVLGVVLLLIFVSLTLISTLNPQGMADFFMNIAASEYTVQIDGHEHDVKMRKLGDGVTSDDRLFVMQKMVVLYIMLEEEGSISENVVEDYNRIIIDAGADNELSLTEFTKLKEYRSDIVSDKDVREWIKIAQALEESEEARNIAKEYEEEK